MATGGNVGDVNGQRLPFATVRCEWSVDCVCACGVVVAAVLYACMHACFAVCHLEMDKLRIDSMHAMLYIDIERSTYDCCVCVYVCVYVR